jgi:branched-chain amino acid aminotransferase
MKINLERTKNKASKPNPSELGFGQYFSDHMFVSEYDSEKGWHDARIQPYQHLSLDPAASVLHYGQALFEGMKVFRQTNGAISLFRPYFNAERFISGATRLCMQAPPAEDFVKAIEELVTIDQDWIPKEKGCSLYVRPTLIGSEGFLGVRPSNEYLFYVILSPVGSYYKEGQKPIKIWVEQNDLRAAPGGLGAVKAGANYAASLQAALKAKQKGYAQVLWLDANREYVEEVGTMNVFFVFKDEIVTPELSGTILPGGTRECVLQLLKDWNLPVRERKIRISEIIAGLETGELTEVFGTGTAAVISPVGELSFQNESHAVSKHQAGPLADRLYKEITGIQYGEVEDRHQWNKIIL